MKCPLLGTMRTAGYDKLHPAFADCIKEKCAWWDGELGCCAMLSIAGWLDSLSLELKTIEDKMPVAKG